MTDRFWRLLNVCIGLICLAAIFGALGLMANIEVRDLDLWLHIGTGRFIVEHNYFVPNFDVLSCTINGNPWNNHEWLFQILVYWIHTLGGAEGLISMQFLLVMLTAGLVLILGYDREKQFFTIISFLFFVMLYRLRFTMRPDLYSLLFFVMDIFILARCLDRKWALGAIFLIQVLWTNMHGFFFFGPLCFLIAFGSEFLKRHIPLPWQWNTVGRLDNDEYKRVAWMFWISCAACLFNPQGIAGALYPLTVMFHLGGENKIFFDYIVELQKPIEWSHTFSTSGYLYYKVMIMLSAVSLYFNRRKIDISVLILYIVFLAFSLSAVRNIVFFAVIAHLVFMANIMTLKLKDVAPIKIQDPLFIQVFQMTLKLMLAVWVMNFIISISADGYYDFDTYERKSIYGGVMKRGYPDGVADFLEKNDFRGNIFNDFNSGAYFIGRLHPKVHVFIDGRTEVYGPEFFKYYRSIYAKQDIKEFDRAMDIFAIGAVVINTSKEAGPEKILKHLYETPQWVAVYLDHDGVIFVRDIPRYKKIIDAHRLDLEHWQVPQLDHFKIGPAKVFPFYHINRAHTLHAMGFKDAAIREAQAAVAITPNYEDVYKILAQCYAEKEDYSKAFENFRIAVMYNPGNRRLRVHLGKVYHELGHYEGAVTEFYKVIERFPDNPEAYFFLTKTFIMQKKADAAWKIIQRAHELAPKKIGDVMSLADVAKEQGLLGLAEKMYRIGLANDSGNGKALKALAQMAEDAGDEKKAKQLWQDVYKLEPDNSEVAKHINALQ